MNRFSSVGEWPTLEQFSGSWGVAEVVHCAFFAQKGKRQTRLRLHPFENGNRVCVLNMKRRLEYWLVLIVVRALGLLPRVLARVCAGALAAAFYHLHKRLRRVGERNLELALPAMSAEERAQTLRGVYRHLGWQMVEFCRMERYTAQGMSQTARLDGHQHYLAASAKGKGVLVITGHLGAWELSSFYHSLLGHPMSMVIRRLDNRLLDHFVNGIRCLHGNRVLPKDDFGRGLLTAMRKGETVGILMDTNITPPFGEFVDFFGVQACTATGLAHIARKTGAAVLPGFMLWEKAEQKYVLHFGPEVEIPHTDNVAADILEGTQRATAAIEHWIRRYPDQWLWIHRRWKTRPEGERPVY